MFFLFTIVPAVGIKALAGGLAERFLKAHPGQNIRFSFHSGVSGELLKGLTAGRGIDIRALIAGALGAKLAVGQNQPDPQQAPAAPAEAAPPAAGQAEEPER